MYIAAPFSTINGSWLPIDFLIGSSSANVLLVLAICMLVFTWVQNGFTRACKPGDIAHSKPPYSRFGQEFAIVSFDTLVTRNHHTLITQGHHTFWICPGHQARRWSMVTIESGVVTA